MSDIAGYDFGSVEARTRRFPGKNCGSWNRLSAGLPMTNNCYENTLLFSRRKPKKWWTRGAPSLPLNHT